ncbi:SoxR reducing system RseC family protein [Paraglaciecola hydrolytica]|uniref:Uncharacterized protein n=1 Tax=Paraglaciecola hydrolytica TaxID=1799789 RepID=A0A136A0A9_9ALTE|nr:SoxR reducing system RseC family protein [Paraglaciecola hydrolytica]KXI28689.1 hypothetical protein AX660_16590 [Paraglaciecola hydrolytica]
MVEEIGIVVRIDIEQGIQYLWIETEVKTTCSSCQAQKNCGTSVVAKAFTNKKQQLKLAYAQTVELGQKIKIGIPEERLLSASLLVYLLPIFALMSGSVLASLVLPMFALDSELWQVLAGFTLAFIAFLGVKNYLNGANQQHFCPQLLGLIEPQPQLIDVKQI